MSHPKSLVLQIVQANPGIHVRRVAHLLGLGWTTCKHHVRNLERDHQLVTVDVQGRVCLYPAARRMALKRARVLLQDPITRAVAALVLRRPGLSQRGIAERLDLATSVVHRRVSALEDADALVRHPDGRATLCFPCPGLDELLAPSQAAALLWSGARSVEAVA